MATRQVQFVIVSLLILSCYPQVNATESTIDRESIMLTVRSFDGPVHESSWLKPLPTIRAQIKSGQEIELEVALFNLAGDLHLKIVEDAEKDSFLLSRTQFTALELPISEVIDLAISNIIARYGEPEVTRERSGLMMVQGKPVDYVASMLFYGELWEHLEKEFPDGLLVAVPSRHTLLFAPKTEPKAIRRLRKMTRKIHSESKRDAVSTSLYYRHNGVWHQKP